MRNSLMLWVALLGLTQPLSAFHHAKEASNHAIEDKIVPVMTRFNPTVHGFKFANNFTVQTQLGGLNGPTFGGLCGGMVYAALDYFNAGKTIPQQNYMPAEGMPLQSYIWNRQQNSTLPNLDKWIEYSTNPFGARNREFFNWGIELGGGRLGELRSWIDRGKPVPLGLKSCGDECKCPGGCPGDHQVLAIGYDMGRYKGDKGQYIEELSIFVYDPNYPGKTLRLRPHVDGAMYLYREETPVDGQVRRCRWRAYFTDTKYTPAAPPTIPNNPNELVVTFHTGGDDLRGGNDNVNIVLCLKSGAKLRFNNVNNGKRWVDFSTQSISRPLDAGFRPEDIAGISVETTFGGGIGGDNWNLDKIEVKTKLGGRETDILIEGALRTLLFRFTGDQRSKDFWRPGYFNKVIATFYTGGDDLRGGNDNVNMVLLLRGRPPLRFDNMNNKAKWSDFTTQTVEKNLPADIRNEDITGISLETTFSGGIGGDNWNLDRIVVKTNIGGVERLVVDQGRERSLLFRFTGDQRVKTFMR